MFWLSWCTTFAHSSIEIHNQYSIQCNAIQTQICGKYPFRLCSNTESYIYIDKTINLRNKQSTHVENESDIDSKCVEHSERHREDDREIGRVQQKRIIYSSINYGIHRIGINYRKCQCVCVRAWWWQEADWMNES